MIYDQKRGTSNPIFQSNPNTTPPLLRYLYVYRKLWVVRLGLIEKYGWSSEENKVQTVRISDGISDISHWWFPWVSLCNLRSMTGVRDGGT